jgi:pimeloyl-ACP methyl ester carboxylesterase
MSRGRRRSRRWILLGSIALAYLLIISFGGCADRLLLFPSRDPADAGRARPHFISVDGNRVEVFTARSPASNDREPQAYVLEFCGNATRAEDITQFVADRFDEHPVEVWVMNYPGFGRSDGPARLASIPPAALATYDELKRVAGERPIFITGNSMGAVTALCVASQRPCAGMILQNPPPLRRIILQRHGWWNLWLFAGPIAMQVPGALNATDTAPRVHAPAVFLVAERDGLVPPKYQQYVIDAYAGPKRIITLKNTGHHESLQPESERELAEAIVWLWDDARD